MNDLVRDALRIQEDERASGFAIHNRALASLLDWAPRELLNLVHELRLGKPAERELSARLLSGSTLPEEIVINEVDLAKEGEYNGDVLRWLVSALKNTRSSVAVSRVKLFATSADAGVRFGVPDALSSCAGCYSEIAIDLDRLSRDPDRDVRWSATFEITFWASGEDERISKGEQSAAVERLLEIAAAEPDHEICELARSATIGE